MAIISNDKMREQYVRDKLKEHYEEAVSLGHEVFCVVVQGSQNYNLDIYNDEYQSDVDTKAIVLPSFDDFCKGKVPTSTTHVRKNNEHIDVKDIRVMFDTFRKQNVNFVEILFSDYYIVPTKYERYWEQLRALGESLTHCHPTQTLKTMAGMSYEKRKALCHPYPTIKDKIEKYGYDGKQLHHIVRVNAFVKNYVKGVSFKDCLTSYDDEVLSMLVNSKLNKYSLSEAIEIADKYNAETDEIKNAYISQNGIQFDGAPYTVLDNIKTEILKSRFRELLLGS